MNSLIIGIGSNESPESNMSFCRQLLSDMFDHIYFSDTSITIPYGEQYKNNFTNQLAFAYTNKTAKEVETCFKLLERQIGRKAIDKENGRIVIDIDLIKWNDTILRKEEWERDYISKLLPSLQHTTPITL